MQPENSSKRLGAAAEQYARHWLEKHNLIHIESNYSCRYGELDLVMRQQREIVIVEVRLRSRGGFGTAADSVHAGKQQKLARTTNHYLQSRNLTESPARIDVLGLYALHPNAVEWIRNAVEIDPT